jgi:uncharacterized protein YbbC (DUF1343 family)
VTRLLSGLDNGLDRLLEDDHRLARLGEARWGLLAHHAAVTRDLVPIHLALAEEAGLPTVLFGPEHGYSGVEQDMVAAEDATDPLTGVPIRSLYGDSEDSLVPEPAAFDGLDLLLVDLQDVGARYYTYAATAVWAAEVAAGAGCPVWVLDRPNPLGGEKIEGGLIRPGFESFVSAFSVPARHGMTLAELVLLEARRRGFEDAVEVVPMEGWSRAMEWPETGRPWIAPSPNMPGYETAQVYPGSCLVEATEISEGRGTTRPFLWNGAPGVDPRALVERLEGARLDGVGFLPLLFRPQFQKHAGEVCAGIEMVVTDRDTFRPYRAGIELLRAFRDVAPEAFVWREKPYEFIEDVPAIDLLTGDERFREALEAGDDAAVEAWIDSWAEEEAAFREERRPVLLYPETADGSR